MNSTFRARWLASSQVISQVLFTSEQPKKNKMVFVGILSQIKLLFGPLVIQLEWYILKQLFTSVSVKVVDIYLAALRLGKCLPLFTSTSVNNCELLLLLLGGLSIDWCKVKTKFLARVGRRTLSCSHIKFSHEGCTYPLIIANDSSLEK